MVVLNGEHISMLAIQAGFDESEARDVENLAEVEQVEHHVHNYESWLGLSGSYQSGVDCGTRDSIDPFVITSGNDDYGDWLCVIGTDDTPIRVGSAVYDPHRVIFFDSDQKEATHRIQFARGANEASASAMAAAGSVSETIVIPATTKSTGIPNQLIDVRCPSGSPLWARVWVDGQDDKDFSFFLGIHEYDA